MIRDANKWELDLEIAEGFQIDVKDSYSCNISGNFDKDQLIEAVEESCTPEEVFDEDRLAKWAEENGYVLEDESA